MYLGIDFLISPEREPYVIEVNVGLPGGAEEYDRTHRVFLQRPSDVFSRIEEISRRVYGRPFKDYFDSLPFIKSLKIFKIWMDGQGPFPTAFHPALRLEDKWVQYQVLNASIPMPETAIFDETGSEHAEAMLNRWGRLAIKRRVGRGGRNFLVASDLEALRTATVSPYPLIIQRHIDSRVNGYALSIRAVAFGGEFVGMYANLSRRAHSNHGILVHVVEGDHFGLADKEFQTEFFNQKSWEAEIWFGRAEPAYLYHNLYEDEVARTALILPGPLFRTIRALSVRIERHYDGLDLTSLPPACFEEGSPFTEIP